MAENTSGGDGVESWQIGKPGLCSKTLCSKEGKGERNEDKAEGPLESHWLSHCKGLQCSA